MQNGKSNPEKQRYDAALRAIYDELYELDVDHDAYRIIYHTPEKYLAPAQSGAISKAVPEIARSLVHPGDAQRFLRFLDLERLRGLFASGRESVLGEFRKLWRDGEYHWSSLTIFPDREAQGEVYFCFVMDIDAKKHADDLAAQNQALMQRQMDDERYRIIVEQTGAMVLDFHVAADSYYASPKIKRFAFGQHTGREIYENRMCFSDSVHPDDQDACLAMSQSLAAKCRAAASGKALHDEMTVRVKRTDGKYVWCKVSVTCIPGQEGTIRRIISTIANVDEAVRTEKALKFRAEYDTLTGIYNQEAFELHSGRYIRRHPKDHFAVLRMDINRFKFINDLYGMREGNNLLRFIAATIREAGGPRAICGRFNSDIFCMCIPFDEARELEELAERLVRCCESYSPNYRAVPSIGICIVDSHDTPMNILCDWANLALKTVKGNLMRKWAFYDDALRARQLDEQNIENEMESALERGQFQVYLQPKHDIATQRVVGAEALVRWAHPTRGLLAPGCFVPLFERNGFVVRMDEYVWEQVFRMLSGWIDEGLTPVPVSINVSRVHAYNPQLYNHLTELLDRYRIPAGLVELELTESTFVENTTELYQTMERLRSRGFQFSMDDFGSGYSSLNMLKTAPVNFIKLDRGFLNETTETEKGLIIVESVISMIRKLGLKVVAEGVESGKQARFLLNADCTVAQGYFFSRPMPEEEFRALAYPRQKDRQKAR